MCEGKIWNFQRRVSGQMYFGEQELQGTEVELSYIAIAKLYCKTEVELSYIARTD